MDIWSELGPALPDSGVAQVHDLAQQLVHLLRLPLRAAVLQGRNCHLHLNVERL